MRRCPICNAVKPVSAFGRRVTSIDAVQARCNDCRRLVESKRCRKCQKTKPLDEFRPEKRGAQGRSAQCRVCRAAYERSLYALKAEQYREKVRRKRAANPEREAAYNAKYREGHRERGRVASKRYAAAHREEIRLARATARRTNPEAAHAKDRALRQRNLDHYRMVGRMATHLRKAQMKQVKIERVDFNRVIERDGMKCHICGGAVTRDTLSFDHLVPIARGGAHAMWNLSVAHRSCNSSRRDGRTPAQLHLPLSP